MSTIRPLGFRYSSPLLWSRTTFPTASTMNGFGKDVYSRLRPCALKVSLMKN